MRCAEKPQLGRVDGRGAEEGAEKVALHEQTAYLSG